MTNPIRRVSVEDAFKSVSTNQDAVMIDVREPDEIAAMAPAVGIVCPMSTIDPATFDKVNSVRKDQPIFLFCRSGNRSMRVALALADQGFSNLANVEGGIIAWQASGLPIKKP
jgi:rhodanese-related sulfurtransferase